MTNSSLVTYIQLSPNNSGLRNHIIDTITIHCVVGQLTAKQICNLFINKSKNAASCNYSIGKDGSIGLCVEEKNRSWCSSSSSNDNRAVTIEVASDTTTPYKITNDAYNSLINLITDICKRNDIKKLLWKADKSLIGQIDKQNMTVHRWFANKSCPGDYLYNLHYDIAEQVNKKLNENKELSYSEILLKATLQKEQWEKCINTMVELGNKTETFSIFKSTKLLIEKIYLNGYHGEKTWDNIIKYFSTSPDLWIIGINALVSAAEADGDLGILETVKYFKILIVKIYELNK